MVVASTANTGQFKSSLVVVNLGEQMADVNILARDSTGRVTGQRSLEIPPKGFFSAANILESLGISNSYGPVEIISRNGQPLLATSRVSSSARTGGFFEAK